MFIRKELNWNVGFTNNENISPEKRVPAVVPGAVQLDWAKAEGWGDYTYGDNWKDYLWMEDVYWSYTSQLDIPATLEGQRLFFVCKGIDYRFKVKLNGEVIHDQEGMFTPFEIDLTDQAASGDILEILIFPAPKSIPLESRAQANQSCKPAVSYGWDWHPRLIPLGIWDETYLEIRPVGHIAHWDITYVLDEELTKADVSLQYRFSCQDAGNAVWKFKDHLGNIVWENTVTTASSSLTFTLDNPILWWPHDHGDPTLYTWQFELLDDNSKVIDSKKGKIGFRRAKLVMHPGAWSEPKSFPMTRSNPPITMEINGRQIFCKGTNWVNPEIFPGIITRDTYQSLISLAKRANMNILRVWGGGIVNKESFFEICDEEGIMVWQEFPLACNNYEGTPEYLKILDQESKSIIKRLRGHASLVMWSGGNELFNGWSGMTDQSLALRLLNSNCYDLDPNTPFIMTSPLMGMAHGSYLFRYENGEEVFQVMPKASNTAYTEFGCPGPSPADYIRTFMPEDELFPPRKGTAWETHHAFDAWYPGSKTWLTTDTLEYYFGPSESLEVMVERGSLLQCEGYKCIYEEGRRQKPKCSMVLNWCYNEPWPTAANNSLISWPAIPKPAYWAVKASCRPLLASARIPKFTWQAGEIFNPELWILNDLPSTVSKGRIEVYLKFGEEEVFISSWEYPELEANSNAVGPVMEFELPQKDVERMTLVLRNPENPDMDSEYVLLYK
jgi:beta-mannosidase